MRLPIALVCAVTLSVAAAHAATWGHLPFTLTAGDPTVGLLPSIRDGYASWSTAGLKSVGGIPNRTTIYQTLSACSPTMSTSCDDTPAINAAIQSCPANEVVQLNAGVFQINGNGLSFTSSNCTLRGAGPGQQLNTGLNKVNGGGTVRACASGILRTIGDGSFCTDATATQLVKADRATNLNYEVLNVDTPGDDGISASTNLAANAVQGTNTLTLVRAPATPIQVGDIVYIDMNTANDPDVFYSYAFYNTDGATFSTGWFTNGRQKRSLTQLMEVTAVANSGTTITFSTPFHTTFTVGNAAQLSQYNNPFARRIGIENLFVWGGQNGDFHGNISINFCAYCWVKNVEAAWSNGTSIGFYSTFRNELRDSYMHETASPNPGGGGYLSGINVGASDNLFENNIMWYGNKEIVMRAAGGGNVVAYNYMDDAFGGGYPDSPEAGVNAGHFIGSHLELLEGNYSQNFKGDSFWGPSIYITVFRNWLSAHRAAHAPLNTYTLPNQCGSNLETYGDYAPIVAAVNVQGYSYYQSFIGNVLGMNGQTLQTEPGPNPCYGPQTEFLEQDYTGAMDDAAGAANALVMWQIGNYEAANWTFIDTTINTQLRQGNWDWVTAAQHWYGTGGTTDGAGGSPVTIPPSFYLTAKPVFFGTQTWPWVDPTTGTTYTLPAKYCFEHGKMPTCLQ